MSQKPYDFIWYCKAEGVAVPVPEHRFDEVGKRRWRFDYAWPDQKVAVEVEGGIWTSGRHTRGKGFLEDMTKYNAATAQGWRVFRVTPSSLVTLETVDMLRAALQSPARRA